jgi:formylglycine-generating enzyme
MSEFNFQKGLKGLAKAAEAIKLNQEMQLELEHGKIEQEELRAKYEQVRLHEDRLEREAAKASLDRQRSLRYVMAEMEASLQSLTQKLEKGIAEKMLGEVSLASHIGLLLQSRHTQLLKGRDALEDLIDIRFMVTLENALGELVAAHPQLLGVEPIQKARLQQMKFADWVKKRDSKDVGAFNPSAFYETTQKITALLSSLKSDSKQRDSRQKIETNQQSIARWISELSEAEKTVRLLWGEAAATFNILAAHQIGRLEIIFITGKEIPDHADILTRAARAQSELLECDAILKEAQAIWHRDRGILETALEQMRNGRFGPAECAMRLSSVPVDITNQEPPEVEKNLENETGYWADLDLEQIRGSLLAEWEMLRINIARTSRWSRRRALTITNSYLATHAESQLISSRLEDFKTALLEDIASALQAWRKRLQASALAVLVLAGFAGAFLYKLQVDADELTRAQSRRAEGDERTPTSENTAQKQADAEIPSPSPTLAAAKETPVDLNSTPAPGKETVGIPPLAPPKQGESESKILLDKAGAIFCLIPASSFQMGENKENETISNLTVSLRAAKDDAALYNESFAHFKKADQLDKRGSPTDALGVYREVTKTLLVLKTKHPNWSPLVVANLAKLTADRIRRLEAQPQPPKAPPARVVTVDAFYMGESEVTFSAWQSVTEWAREHGYEFSHPGEGAGESHPVTGISWHDVAKWCNAKSEMEGCKPCYYTANTHADTEIYKRGEQALAADMVDWGATGYRLPTESEWEKAARGGLVGSNFPLGETLQESDANFGNRTGGTQAVKSHLANAYGLYDMAGNVSEWCWDWSEVPPAEGAAANGITHAEASRIERGGGWMQPADSCRVSHRAADKPEATLQSRGFRLARTH